MSDKNLPTWEVFIQPKIGAPFQHAGNVHASDKEMALQNARELYTRRQEGTCIWVVKTEDIVSSNPEDQESFLILQMINCIATPLSLRYPKRQKDYNVKRIAFQICAGSWR